MTLRELHEAATPAPWRYNDREDDSTVLGGDEYVAVYIAKDGVPEDLALIAAMRNALPLLLDVVDAARELGAANDEWNETYALGNSPAHNAAVARQEIAERKLSIALAALDGAA